MKDFLQLQFLDNAVKVYLEVAGAILITLILKRIVSKYLAALLYRMFTKAGKQFHRQAFIELIIEPLDAFIITLVVIISFDKLTLPTLLHFTIYKATSHEMLDAIANTALVITFIRLCLRFMRFASMILEEKANLTPDQADNQLIIFFRDFLRVILYIIAGLLILRFTFSYDISKLVTGLSLVGAAIALATKESLENLIASFIIFFDKPFSTGDLVKVQGFTGNVERIGLRSTRIRTDQKTYITVPNKQMVDTILDNVSLRTQRRAEIKLEIALTANALQLKKVIPEIKAMLAHEAVLSSTVFLSDTGRSAHIITVEFFTTMAQSIEEFTALRETINLSLIELLQKNDLKLAAVAAVVFRQEDDSPEPLPQPANTNNSIL